MDGQLDVTLSSVPIIVYIPRFLGQMRRMMKVYLRLKEAGYNVEQYSHEEQFDMVPIVRKLRNGGVVLYPIEEESNPLRAHNVIRVFDEPVKGVFNYRHKQWHYKAEISQLEEIVRSILIIPAFIQRDNFQKMKILVVSNSNSACFRYRIKHPMDYMEYHGLAEIDYIDPACRKELSEIVTKYHVVVFQFSIIPKFMIRTCEIIRENKLPILVVLELDDDFFNINPTNIGAYKQFGVQEKFVKGLPAFKDGVNGFNLEDNKERVLGLMKALTAVDIVTVTSHGLKEVYSEYNPNVIVLPNYLDPLELPDTNNYYNRKMPITIGWHGGDSHYHDLREVMDVFRNIKEQYNRLVNFQFMGASFKIMYQRNCKGRYLPWVNDDAFPEYFAKTLPDIAVIPSAKHVFNKGKSPIKFYEYAYHGIPCVVANLPPYQGVVTSNTGLLYDNKSEMFEALVRLIEQPQARAFYGKNARNYVSKECTIDKNYGLWFETYSTCLKRKIEYMNESKLILPSI